jgi:predicted DsbA family dithiol-disulfide isomerase
MLVEIWSDVICPWCGLANYRLDEALRRFGHQDQVEVVHRSFIMAPDLPGGQGLTQREVLRRVGKTGEAAERYIRPIEALAKRDGLQPYIVMDNRLGSTALAHEFLAYATEQGRHGEAWRRAFRAHFGQARTLFDAAALVSLGAELDLPEAGVREALTSRRFRGQVEAEHRQALELGARGVPFTVIDGRYAMTGAQEIALLTDALSEAWRTAPHPLAVLGDQGGTCDGDTCAVPAP